MSSHTNTYTAISFFTLLLFGFNSDHSSAKTHRQIKRPTAWTAGWSYDDKFAAIGNSDGELTIYETTNWRKIRSWSFKGTTVSKVEWNPKYPILAVAAFSHEKVSTIIQLYDVTKDQILSYLVDTLFGRALSWNPTGEEIAFVGKKGRISLFTKSGKFQRSLSFQNQGSLFDIDWHPTKNLLLAVEEDIFLIDIDGDSLVATYDDGSKNKGILSCAWHPSGNSFVTGDYGHENEGGEPSYLKYWNKEGSLQVRIKESKSEYRNVKWRKDGKYLAAASDVLLILNDKGKLINKIKFDDNNLWGVEWNSKGDKIIVSDQAGTIRVTDSKGAILKSFKQ